MRSSAWLKLARELVFVVMFGYLYELIRGEVVQSGAIATRHAFWVIDIEKALGLFQERRLQSVFLHSYHVIRTFNLYYGGTHFIVPIATLIWLAVRHPDHYSRARNLLAATTAVGFVCFALFPVAPPRLLPPRYGIVDTIRHLGDTHAAGVLLDRAGNAYAAMPSLHMAWAVWCTIALYPVLQHRWSRIVAVLYPIMTALVVVVTGNHFIADFVTGTLLIFAVDFVLSQLSRRRSATIIGDFPKPR